MGTLKSWDPDGSWQCPDLWTVCRGGISHINLTAGDVTVKFGGSTLDVAEDNEIKWINNKYQWEIDPI